MEQELQDAFCASSGKPGGSHAQRHCSGSLEGKCF